MLWEYFRPLVKQRTTGEFVNMGGKPVSGMVLG